MSATAVAPLGQDGNSSQVEFDNGCIAGALVSPPATTCAAFTQQSSLTQSAYVQQPSTTYAAPATTTCMPQSPATAAPTTAYSVPLQAIGTQSVTMAPAPACTEAVRSHPGTMTYVTDAVQAAPTFESPITTTYRAATNQAAPVTYAAMQHQVQYTATVQSPMVSYQQYAHIQQPIGLPMAHSMVAYPAGTSLLQPRVTQPEVAPQVSAAVAEVLNGVASESAQTQVSQALAPDAAEAAPTLEPPVTVSYQVATPQAAFVAYAAPHHHVQYTPTLQAPMVSYQQCAQLQQPIGLPMAHSMVACPAGTSLLQPRVTQPEVAPQVSDALAEVLNEVASESAQAQVSQASFPDAAQATPTLESPVTASYQGATTRSAPVAYAAPQNHVQYTSTLEAPMVSYQQYAQPIGLPVAQSMVTYPAGTVLLQPRMTQPEIAPQVSATPAEALNEVETASAQAQVEKTASTQKTSNKSKTSKKHYKKGCC